MLLSVVISTMLGLATAAPGLKASSFGFASPKIRGVNLGGWFVLEPWITPSLFEAHGNPVDEYNFCRNLGRDACSRVLTQHWDTFYTAADFQAIAAAGLNHVRIPIGHWAVNPQANDPYVQGQLKFFDQAVLWARAAGLKVWVDLHGAPGSQNGFDNSGLRDRLEWQQGDNIKKTVEAIRTLSARYAAPKYADTVTAIELLNEPLGPKLDRELIKQYWMDGWGTVRDTSSDIAVVIGDAFFAPKEWNGFMKKGWNNVVLDTHHYQVFSPEQNAMNIDQHVGAACAQGWSFREVDKPIVCGEWSAALTDCTKYLNGIGRGARYDGAFGGGLPVGSCAGRVQGSVASFSPEEREKTRRYVEAQLDAYEQGAGWFFWTWKAEGAPQWEMRDLIKSGVFPQPLKQRKYPNQCGFPTI